MVAAQTVERLQEAYSGAVPDSAFLARLVVKEITTADADSQDFEVLNVKKLLGSDTPQTPTDLPRFEHYYDLAGHPERAGERIVWFGRTALQAFDTFAGEKLATELGGKKLWGEKDGMQQLYDFEQDALDQVTEYDPHAFVHRIHPGLSPSYRAVTIRPVYLDKERKHPSPHVAVVRAREAVADVHAPETPMVELFRTTHWLAALKIIEDVDTREKLLGAIQISHEAMLEGKRSFVPSFADQLYAEVYAQPQDLPSYIPLTTRSLAMMRRSALEAEY
jgi:hypothetical protein